ncbi:extracellular dihydrogeodin oxidase/laccase [Aspergillus transmontanensis]|uniref:laccase n=1 Tax=Aspergillus transmontanensis TaxID=1034304 RepID=A0A5N6W3C0_9EURO|nr:extracellular dihydrogeodin oxidase/laccase [Aspergillus transmontanensis]
MRWSSLFAALLLAATTVSSRSLARGDSDSASACAGNTPETRDQWCDFDIRSDYYTEVPDTGVTREFWLVLGNTTTAPDGVPRNVLTVNGTSPGPTLHVNWGDWVRIHVYNGLENNGTSIHWHGIRQNHTNPQDGTNSITQCPVPPGGSITYEWQATQYGHTYYHSHFALQAWEGIYGGIVINGPASANYDVDAGILYLSDWSHRTADSLYSSAETDGEPTLATGLMNATNIWVKENNQTVGSRFNMNVTEGQSYRLRLLNPGMSNPFRFMIDDHILTVISTDFVPIEPYNTTSVLIGVGQRYDVIVHANKGKKGSNFWLRAIPQEACAEISNYDIRGIFHYEKPGSKLTNPTTTAFAYTDSCDDEAMSDLVPMVALDASGVGYTSDNEVQVIKNTAGLYKWYMGPTSFMAEWDNPTLLQIEHGNTSWTNSSHVVEVEGNGQWVIIDIEMTINVPHPIHLHGHDFYVLAQAEGTFSSNTTLNTVNPPRRDTATLPALGYLVIAFKTDNPGAWLLHCHIGWHQSEGFAMQFVESIDQLKPMIDGESLERNCAAWDQYATQKDIVEDDSGI